MENKMNDFYRNVTFFDNYDENSFIGQWVDNGVWSDEEYWKLDLALKEIKISYPYPRDIPRDIAAGVFRIIELMMVPNWHDFSISSENTNEEVTIYERFERFKYAISSIFTGDEIADSDFLYKK